MDDTALAQMVCHDTTWSLALPWKACRHLSFLFFFWDHECMILKKKIFIIIINKKRKRDQVCRVVPKILKLKPVSLSQNKNEKEKFFFEKVKKKSCLYYLPIFFSFFFFFFWEWFAYLFKISMSWTNRKYWLLINEI